MKIGTFFYNNSESTIIIEKKRETTLFVHKKFRIYWNI